MINRDSGMNMDFYNIHRHLNSVGDIYRKGGVLNSYAGVLAEIALILDYGGYFAA